jgi:hypothetical protein
MRRNGVIRQVTVVMRHHVIQFIVVSKNLVAMIVAPSEYLAKSLNTTQPPRYQRRCN